MVVLMLKQMPPRRSRSGFLKVLWSFSVEKHVKKKDDSAKQYVGEAKNNDLWQGSRAENQWGTNNGGT